MIRFADHRILDASLPWGENYSFVPNVVKSTKNMSRGDYLSKKCWEIRGCTQDMHENCFFGSKNVPCELPCHWAASACNQYEIVASADFINQDVDFSQVNVQKQQCFYCKVLRGYLKNDKSGSQK